MLIPADVDVDVDAINVGNFLYSYNVLLVACFPKIRCTMSSFLCAMLCLYFPAICQGVKYERNFLSHTNGVQHGLDAIY